MPQTSLGGVSNSASKAFTNAKGNMALVNFGKIHGSQSIYEFNAQNSINQNTLKNINTLKSIKQSVWSGSYNKNIIY
jgi:hypothetical protein